MTTTYNVEGMTCGHCVASVTEEVQQVPGVERAIVELEGGVLKVEGDAPREAIEAAVAEAGYSLK